MPEISVDNVVIDGVRSTVRSASPEGSERDAEAVVFVHGNPGSSEDFLDLMGRVGEFARVVAPDMPGYGKADRPEGFDYTLAGYGKHLAGVLDALGVQRAHLVLHDFGGGWGMQFAADHPERARSFTLLNIGVLPGYRWHKFARIWRTPVLGEVFQAMTTRFALGLLLDADNPKPFPKAFVDRMYADADDGMKRAVLALYRATDDRPDGLMVPQGEALKPYNKPALVLWGEGDKYLPVRFAEVQRQYFDAEVHRLPRCGHWPMIDAPEQVAEFVLPYLREQLGIRLTVVPAQSGVPGARAADDDAASA